MLRTWPAYSRYYTFVKNFSIDLATLKPSETEGQVSNLTKGGRHPEPLLAPLTNGRYRQ